MIEAVAASPLLPLPAELAALVAVKGLEGVFEPEGLETLDQGQLGRVPALSALGPEVTAVRASERPDAAVRVFAAGRIEIAAQRRRAVRRPGQVGVDCLVGTDLDQVRLGADRRVEVDQV